MNETSEAKKQIRFTFEIGQDLLDRTERLAEREERTKSSICRHALKLYLTAKEAKEA